VNVVLASYQAVSLLRGGPNTQIRGTARFLGEFGVAPLFFDQWKPLKRAECDLVHLFGANIGTYHLAREIAALEIPLVVSPILFSSHSAAFVRNALSATRVAQRLGPGIWSDYAISADICRWAAMVLPNTRAEADLVARGLGVPREKLQVVPNGVDERFRKGDPRLFAEKHGLEGFVLNVGHIGPGRKNVRTLIKALGRIDRPAVLIGRIAGGPEGEACLREAEKHKNVLVLEGLDNESEMLASAYAACDVFVLPSLYETPGIAALEAGLAGAKIVITPYGGTREYFGDMAIYVEPDSVDSIREGILAALDRPSDGKLQEKIEREFLWREVARKTALVYEDVLSQGRR
jgi:glycosyltransferase involved in cell wall biosynthesis